jgi:hypothetical protein
MQAVSSKQQEEGSRQLRLVRPAKKARWSMGEKIHIIML